MLLEPILDRAISTENRPSAAEVVQALLEIEQDHRKKPEPVAEAQLMGDWQLHFVSIGKVRPSSKRLRGLYVPSFLGAQIGFKPSESDEAPLQVTNQVTIGLVHLKFTGPARFQTKKNVLAFDFTRFEVSVLGQRVYEGAVPSSRTGQKFSEISIGRLPFFAFFMVFESSIAARGRGGGLAMWVKNSVG